MEQYSREEILNIVEEEDVEFIRLQFTDMFGTMKNIAIPAGRKLPKAMDDRCIIDASSIEGFIRTEESEMYLSPDLTTFSILPWRPQQERLRDDLRSDTHGRNSLRGKPQIPPQRGSEKGGKAWVIR